MSLPEWTVDDLRQLVVENGRLTEAGIEVFCMAADMTVKFMHPAPVYVCNDGKDIWITAGQPKDARSLECAAAILVTKEHHGTEDGE